MKSQRRHTLLADTKNKPIGWVQRRFLVAHYQESTHLRHKLPVSHGTTKIFGGSKGAHGKGCTVAVVCKGRKFTSSPRVIQIQVAWLLPLLCVYDEYGMEGVFSSRGYFRIKYDT